MGVCNCSMFCCTLLYVHSSIVIILIILTISELIIVFLQSCDCLCFVSIPLVTWFGPCSVTIEFAGRKDYTR